MCDVFAMGLGCKLVVLFIGVPLVALAAFMTMQDGRTMYMEQMMKLRRDMLLPTLAPGDDGIIVPDPSISYALKVISAPYVLGMLATGGPDFRRTMFKDCRDLSGGYSAAYGPWVDGVAQFSHQAVSADADKFWKQVLVSSTSDSSAYVCLSGWPNTDCHLTDRSGEVGNGNPSVQILLQSLKGLCTAEARFNAEAVSMLVPPGLPTDVDEVSAAQIVSTTGIALWRRMFGPVPWSEDLEELAELFVEFYQIRAACADGMYQKNKARVDEIVQSVTERMHGDSQCLCSNLGRHCCQCCLSNLW